MVSEFKTFLTKTNALALAIGVIIGAALGSVVNSLVKDIIMPPVGWLLGGVDFASLTYALPEKDGNTVTINYGVFINTIVTFVIVAFVVFWVAKMFIREEAAAPTKDCPFCREANAIDATKCKFCASPI
jgi:large conductance mechanosensitive channel